MQPSSPSARTSVGVGGGQVGPERVEVGVDVLVDRGPAAAVVDHARRGDGQLRRRAVADGVLQEREVVREDRLVRARSGSSTRSGGGRELERALGVVELRP